MASALATVAATEADQLVAGLAANRSRRSSSATNPSCTGCAEGLYLPRNSAILRATAPSPSSLAVCSAAASNSSARGPGPSARA
jgi:hypothetical protein